MARLSETLKLALAGATLLALAGCRPETEPGKLRFWAFGREGEVVRDLIPEFERQNPSIRVEVQQIPWTAAHEKLMTAFVGRTTPDLVQLGNTWVPEFTALDALEPLDTWLAKPGVVDKAGYFPGIWETNVIGPQVFGIPWYVDTRVLFYRRDLLGAAGIPSPPRTWEEWRTAMKKLQKRAIPGGSAILLPTNEWTQPVILGMQAGSSLLRDGDRFGAFSQAEFRQGAEFYISLFEEGLAPAVTNNQISNVYQEFDAGVLSMWITGPWCIGEFRRRLPPSRQNAWDTAPLPSPASPDAPGVSLAGGSSLALFRASSRKQEAWKLLEFLSRPETQIKFYGLTGDLPARTEAWKEKSLTEDPKARAFATQLAYVRSTPKVPEWEAIATRVQEHMESVIKKQTSLEKALTALDADTDRILEKRRFILEKRGSHAR